MRLVKSILKHSNDRNPGRFDWINELSDAHLVFVSADNEGAMQEWQQLSARQPAPVMLSITQKVPDSSPAYCLIQAIFAFKGDCHPR